MESPTPGSPSSPNEGQAGPAQPCVSGMPTSVSAVTSGNVDAINTTTCAATTAEARPREMRKKIRVEYELVSKTTLPKKKRNTAASRIAASLSVPVRKSHTSSK